MLTCLCGGLTVEVLSIRNKPKETGESNLPSERCIQPETRCNPITWLAHGNLGILGKPLATLSSLDTVQVVGFCGDLSHYLRAICMHWERRVRDVPAIVVVNECLMFPTLRHLPSWDRWVRETGKGGLIKDG